MSDREESEDDENSVSSIVRVIENDPDKIEFKRNFRADDLQNMRDEELEEFGNAISNNIHLNEVSLAYGCLDDHKMSCLFRGLTRSSSITKMDLDCNELSVAAVRSMEPFLQNANNLIYLALYANNIQSEGFNLVLRALRGSPIERINCCRCGIESIVIDTNHIPRHLKFLDLSDNGINADGCRQLAKILQEGDSTLEDLNLCCNAIDDECIAILVDALQSNTSLKLLYLFDNAGISKRGKTSIIVAEASE